MCFVAFHAYICWWSVYEWRSHVFKLHLWINEIIYLFKCKFKRDNKHRTWLRVFLLLLLPRFLLKFNELQMFINVYIDHTIWVECLVCLCSNIIEWFKIISIVINLNKKKTLKYLWKFKDFFQNELPMVNECRWCRLIIIYARLLNISKRLKIESKHA